MVVRLQLSVLIVFAREPLCDNRLVHLLLLGTVPLVVLPRQEVVPIWLFLSMQKNFFALGSPEKEHTRIQTR